MGDNDQSEDNSNSSTDLLSLSVRKRQVSNDNDNDNTGQDQQPPVTPLTPLSSNQPLSNVAVCSVLQVETDPKAIESLEIMLNSVVKIFCTAVPYSFIIPWQVKYQSNKTASGFIIDNRRILSNAHAVANQSIIRIQKHGDPKKYPGRILHIAHECDFVIMTVDDDKFWDNVKPLTFNNNIPNLQDEVIVVGYPIGGDNLSVTKGVISRVCMQNYTHSLEYLLAIQVDAAINPGNSGGPVIQGKQVVGMSFQGRRSAQSIGYIIPVPIIQHVLRDIELHQKYTAFPRLPFECQLMENSSLRKYFKLNDNQHGILITSIAPGCALNQILQKDDVIIAIDNVPIADNGSIDFRRGERLNFRYLKTLKYVGDEMKFTIIRQGQELTLTSPLENTPPLVPYHSHDKRPEYVIYAGFVFTVLSRFYLRLWDENDFQSSAPKHLAILANNKNGYIQEPNQQVVIICQVLADDVNYGIDSNVIDTILKTINGIKIKNLQHLAELIDQLSTKDDNDYIRFETDCGKVIAIECKEAQQAEARILAQNSIAHARSENLRSNLSH